MNVTTIPATIEMSAEIAQLCQTLGHNVTVEDMRTRLTKIIANNDHMLLVAQAEGKIIGYCHGYVRILTEIPTDVEIGGLAVSDDFQGQGVGKKLVTGIEDWTKSIGLDTVALASNIKREAAHQFYEHLGYTKLRQQFAFEKKL